MRIAILAAALALLPFAASADPHRCSPYSDAAEEAVVAFFDEPSTATRCQADEHLFRCMGVNSETRDMIIAEWRMSTRRPESNEYALCDVIRFPGNQELFDWDDENSNHEG
jgi:hypothetical protein